MLLDDMAEKKEMSEAFTYHYEVNASNQLVALFWCDGLMKMNYHMFGDIVVFDSTYNTNRQFWIPTYFRDFPLGSMIRTTSISESENSFYKKILKPRANIAEFYLNLNNAVEFQRNSRTKLDYHDAIVLPILVTTLPFEKHVSTLYTDSMFKKIQKEIIEGNDRCRVLGFSSTDMVDTYKLGDNNHNSHFVRHDKTDDSYSNNEVKKITDRYCQSIWMKTPLPNAIHGQFDYVLPTTSIVDDRQTVSNQGISMFYGFLRRFVTDIDVLRAFVDGVKELGNSLQTGTPTTSASEKRRLIEEFYVMVRPEVVEVHPLDIVKTKGHAISSASRLIYKREKVIKETTRPLRRCKACDEMGHHDSRNCPMLKEMAAEKELRKGKRKY
ncbi:uncharacterized protein LOC121744691 [Salvia splendens]|uniref:uncharacterized protein LOC121744691 n=1 Tax=Salvia splendens TaxID=180675 RepID=UPI001C25BDC6|nr:uncharacterized protein LOC121744691 [Salvia splendens]